MLVDAAGLYFRAFHGVPASIVAPDGTPINAVRGYLDMTATLITRRRPTRYIACLDYDWRPAFRVALLPSYKAHRVAPDGAEDVPDDLSPQVPILLDFLAALGLCSLGASGFEADDVIATLAARADAAGEAVEVVTGDRDLMAVATDHVRVLYTGRGLAKLEDLGPAEVIAKYGISPALYPDFAMLRGDSSDGLPGVPGVGERTAAALVSRFGAIEQIVAAAQDTDGSGFPAGSRAKVLAALDYLAVAPGVVRGRTDVPVPATLPDALPASPADPERLVDLSDQWGLGSSVERMLQALAKAHRT
jgi:5'-3' exonuclease